MAHAASLLAFEATPAGHLSLSFELTGRVIDVARLERAMFAEQPRHSARKPSVFHSFLAMVNGCVAPAGCDASSCMRVLRRSRGLHINAATAPVVAPTATSNHEGAGMELSWPMTLRAWRVSGSYNPRRNE
eukprot:CAMPEP_0182831298 /NCGR_PEP_ID=MMETSP0006_2-20121128/19050_1 /TAXON_ID=97485 /ORGANISM="Prymnesium parvum, Strain Texoma1" /LENGTH=130 /DNA_ID=CAMNT_0024958955 /DNA_START=280 /DNA_END=669 /DNA_ORIENTATION=-